MIVFIIYLSKLHFNSNSLFPGHRLRGGLALAVFAEFGEKIYNLHSFLDLVTLMLLLTLNGKVHIALTIFDIAPL